jgi:hypothetical protein
MVKVILQLYPQVQATRQERIDQRPLGRDADRYQALIRDMPTIVRAADELGLWGISSIEHHFHSEGYEVGPNPGLLDAYWAAITKNIHVGTLGYVMSTQNPIRVAEETAIVNHLARGRSFVGFARGYQSRWTNVLGQHLGARATKSPEAAIYNPQTQAAVFSAATSVAKDKEDDTRNRAIFEESMEIVLKAWTQESSSHKGLNWQIPFPHDTGVDDWPLARAGVTQRLGAPGEIDEKTGAPHGASASRPRRTRSRTRRSSSPAPAARRPSPSAASTASCRPTSPRSAPPARSPSTTARPPPPPAAASSRGRTSRWCAGSRSARARRTRWTASGPTTSTSGRISTPRWAGAR